MKLTERDKKLLLILAYFVIIVGFGAFVFKPLFNYYLDVGDRVTLLTAQKEEMDRQLEEGRGLEQRRNELSELFRISTQDIYPMLGSEEVDKEITGIVLSCGMQALNLNITMPEEAMQAVMYPYAQGREQTHLPEGETDALDLFGETDTAEQVQTERAEEIQGHIYAPVVTLTAGGSSAQVENLIDKLMRDYPGIRVRSYARQQQAGNLEGEGAEMEFLSLELELYMCDKSVSKQGEKP